MESIHIFGIIFYVVALWGSTMGVLGFFIIGITALLISFFGFFIVARCIQMMEAKEK